MDMRRIATIIFLAALPFAVSAEGADRTEHFKKPDIKEEFCGAKIDFRICKCAFHGEYCKELGRTRNIAAMILDTKFGAYVSDLKRMFQATCRSGGGKLESDGTRCVYREPSKEKQKCVPEDFEKSWKKYSDFDDAIPDEERSYEAKEHRTLLTKRVENAKEIFLLKRDMEIDRLSRAELKQYKAALVGNIKANLLRSFWRLAWITYDNIQGARSSGGTFEKLYDLESLGEGMAAYLKVVRSVTPADSKVAINTETVSGKVKSVGLSTALDAIESVGDPYAVATTLVSESVKSTYPSADITPEEIEILRTQHVKNRAIDQIIEESYRINRERRDQIITLERENESLLEAMAAWEEKERERVRGNIVAKCENAPAL